MGPHNQTQRLERYFMQKFISLMISIETIVRLKIYTSKNIGVRNQPQQHMQISWVHIKVTT